MSDLALFGLDLPPTEPLKTLSKKGFAELIGVSQGRVSQMIADGLPVEPNGRVDRAKGIAWVDANIDPNRRRALQPDEAKAAAVSSFASPRAMRDTHEAEIARLKAGKMAANLIDRKAALRAVETRAKGERDAWIGWVNRVAPEIARELDTDLAKTVALLDKLVRDQLAALAEIPLERLTNAGY